MVARARLAARAHDGEGFPESAYAAVEAAGNRMLEVSGALEGRRPMRMPFGLGVPSRGAPFPDLVVPAVEGDALAAALAAATARETAHEAELRRRYGYNVVTRNCVTEIFRTIDAAFAAAAPAGADVREESARRLGGHVDAPLNFIPAAAAVSVRESYAVSETIELPSYRLAALARMYRRENPVRVYLRESNTADLDALSAQSRRLGLPVLHRRRDRFAAHPRRRQPRDRTRGERRRPLHGGRRRGRHAPGRPAGDALQPAGADLLQYPEGLDPLRAAAEGYGIGNALASMNRRSTLSVSREMLLSYPLSGRLPT